MSVFAVRRVRRHRAVGACSRVVWLITHTAISVEDVRDLQVSGVVKPAGPANQVMACQCYPDRTGPPNRRAAPIMATGGHRIDPQYP